MDDLTGRLRRLGAAVAEVSDRTGPSVAEASLQARRAFVDDPRRSRSSAWIPALAAAALVALAATGWRVATSSSRGHLATSALAPSGPAPAASLSFSIGSVVERRAGVVGEWLAGAAFAPQEARFSDGSALQLAPGASMRVTTTSPVGAEVLLERGLVHAVVAHPAGVPARWVVHAGPFEVHVTGTTFDAAWDPEAETFELTMLEGRVVVTGPSVPPARAVRAGEHLAVSVRSHDGGSAPKPPAEGSRDGVASSLPAEGARDGGGLSAGEAAHRAVRAHPAWRDLVAKGRYRDAFTAAEAAGLEEELDHASASDLLLLADAARFSASPGHAREALLAARQRFGTRGQSAFLLGKIAADQQGSAADAVAWFETYLREEPAGPHAEEALGRIVELTPPEAPAAQQAAARYLTRYPDGSRAARARRLTR